MRTVKSMVSYCHMWLHQYGNHLEVNLLERERPRIKLWTSGFKTNYLSLSHQTSKLLLLCFLWLPLSPLLKFAITFSIVFRKFIFNGQIAVLFTLSCSRYLAVLKKCVWVCVFVCVWVCVCEAITRNENGSLRIMNRCCLKHLWSKQSKIK